MSANAAADTSKTTQKINYTWSTVESEDKELYISSPIKEDDVAVNVYVTSAKSSPESYFIKSGDYVSINKKKLPEASDPNHSLDYVGRFLVYSGTNSGLQYYHKDASICPGCPSPAEMTVMLEWEVMPSPPPPPEECSKKECICAGPACEYTDDGCEGEDCICTCDEDEKEEEDEDPPEPYKCAPQLNNCQPIRESACLLPQYNGSGLIPAYQVTARGDKRLDTACHSLPYKDEVLTIALNYDGLYVADGEFSDRSDNWFGPGWTMNHMQRLKQSPHHPVSYTEKEEDSDTLYYYTLSSGEEFVFAGRDGDLELYPKGLTASGSTVKIREVPADVFNWENGASVVFFEDGSFEVYKTLDPRGLIRAACTSKSAPLCKVYHYTEDGLLLTISLVDFIGMDSLEIIEALKNPSAGSLKRLYSVTYKTVNDEHRISRIKDVTPAVVGQNLAGAFDFSYHSSGLLASITWPDGAKEAFEYDSDDRLVRHYGTAENPNDLRNAGNTQNGAYTQSVYDSMGRIKANLWGAAEQTITYAGDNIAITTQKDGVTLATTHVTVDNRKRVSGISVPNNAAVQTTFTYCSDVPHIEGCSHVQNSNQLQAIHYPLGAATTYTFDQRGHVLEKRTSDGSSPQPPEYQGIEPNTISSPTLSSSETSAVGLPIPHVGVVNAYHNWNTIHYESLSNPLVVIAGVPSFNGKNAGVAQVKDVTAEGFSIRFAEWLYTDGKEAVEQIPYGIFRAGSYTYNDGTVVEAGTFSIDDTIALESIEFDQSFPATPHVFLTPQTTNESHPVTVRAQDVNATGFKAALYEEEALNDGHAPEVIGYVAIYPGSGTSGSLGGDINYALDTLSLTHENNHVLLLQEEQSKDTETSHSAETIHVMILNGEYFGQDVTSEELDTHSLRKP